MAIIYNNFQYAIFYLFGHMLGVNPFTLISTTTTTTTISQKKRKQSHWYIDYKTMRLKYKLIIQMVFIYVHTCTHAYILIFVCECRRLK